MSDVVWIAISSVCGVLALWIAYLTYRERRRDAVTQGEAARIRQIVHAETESVTAAQRELAARLDAIVSRQNQIAAEQHDQSVKISAILDRMAVTETKIEVFWKSVAMDAAKIIHSPDPRRAHVDALLESFMGGTLSGDQERELRAILMKIRDFEPGGARPDFPVYQGEQLAAAILLRTMEHVAQGGARR
jgi:hypothetical protein